MLYTDIGISEKVSRIILGCATQDMLAGNDCAMAVLDAAVENGICTFDTARVYGESEAVLGRWMRTRHNRENVVLISKGCHPDRLTGEDYLASRMTANALKEDLETSFRLLGTDYIDIYLLHRDAPGADMRPILEVLHQYVSEGKIGMIGGSNWSAERIREINALAKREGLTPFGISSPNYSLAAQVGDCWHGGVNIAGEAHRAEREWYAKEHMPIVAYAALGHGLFSGRVRSSAPESKNALDSFGMEGFYGADNLRRLQRAEILSEEKHCTVAQIALAWLLHQPLCVLPVLGTSRVQGVSEGAAATEIKLTEAECDWLNLAIT